MAYTCRLGKSTFHLVVLESTTYPGTASEVMLPILERSGLKREHRPGQMASWALVTRRVIDNSTGLTSVDTGIPDAEEER